MSSPANPAQTRSYIVERLIGASGASDQVTSVARTQADRALPQLTKNLNDSLSSRVEVAIKAIEIGRQGDMKEVTGATGAMTVVASASSGDALIMGMDAAGIAIVTNALFGGEPDSWEIAERGPTAIELDATALVFEKAAAAFNGTGARSLNLKFPLASPITGDDLAKKILRDGPSVRVHYSLLAGSGVGTLFLSMPQRVLLQHRGGGATVGEPMGVADWAARFSGQVMRSSVRLEASVLLGRMTLSEIAALEEGQVLELPPMAQSQTKLGAKKKPLFVGEFGKLGQNYTIRIRHPFDAGQELMDEILPS